MLDGAVQNEPPPHECGFFLVNQETHGNDFDPAFADAPLVRFDLCAITGFASCEPALDTDHPRDRITPDICVEHPHGETLVRNGSSQVHGHGALTDTTLTASDHDDPSRRRDLVVWWVLGDTFASPRHDFGLFALLKFSPVDLDFFHTRQLVDAANDVFLNLGSQGAAHGGQRDRDMSNAVVTE